AAAGAVRQHGDAASQRDRVARAVLLGEDRAGEIDLVGGAVHARARGAFEAEFHAVDGDPADVQVVGVGAVADVAAHGAAGQGVGGTGELEAAGLRIAADGVHLGDIVQGDAVGGVDAIEPDVGGARHRHRRTDVGRLGIVLVDDDALIGAAAAGGEQDG